MRTLHCLLLAFSLFSIAENAEDSVIIETKYGKIEGELVKAQSGGFTAAVFKGVQYGTAKRLEKPQPVEPWTDIKQARTWGSRCPQHQFTASAEPVVASDVAEECLCLNVFSPYKSHGLPVMVFVHGGGLAVGSSTYYGQEGIVDWLLPKGVLVVTINYRLGPFGFFSTGTAEAPGNYGFWDQTLALIWVKENIDRFGGDPGKVTVFGESAGGVSVSMLTLSPHSRDLFQQAIIMSGTSLMPRLSGDGLTLELSDWLAKELKCGSIKEENIKGVVDCVKAKPAIEILTVANSLDNSRQLLDNMFVPVVDGDFFPQPILELHETAPPKPTIIGTMGDEAAYFVTPPVIYENTSWLIDNYDSFTLEQFHNKVAPLFADYPHSQLLQRLALHHYVDSAGDRTNTSFLVEKFKQILSDWVFIAPSYKEAVLKLKRGSSVWLYSFDYYDNAVFPTDHKSKGAQHFMELPYLFNFEDIYHVSPWKGDELKISNLLVTLWTNFAIHGDPNNDQSVFRNQFSWDPINNHHPDRYLRIGLDTKQMEAYHRHGVSFWLELLPDVLKTLENKKELKMGQKATKAEL